MRNLFICLDFFLKILGEWTTFSVSIKCGEIEGKQNIVSGRKIHLFIEGENVQVSHNTTFTTKHMLSACQANSNILTQC